MAFLFIKILKNIRSESKFIGNRFLRISKSNCLISNLENKLKLVNYNFSNIKF